MEEKIAGFVMLVLGGFMAVRPDLMLRCQTWTQRIIMGAKYEPGPRTYKIARLTGAFIVVLGLLILTGIIK